MVELTSWFLMGWTVLNMWLIGNKTVWAWYSAITSQAAWLYFDYLVGAYGLMPLAVVLTVIYVRNIRKWRKEMSS